MTRKLVVVLRVLSLRPKMGPTTPHLHINRRLELLISSQRRNIMDIRCIKVRDRIILII